MSSESLCIRTFAEVVRGRMNKKAQIKNFNMENKAFQSDAEAERNNKDVNLSQVFPLYKLLLDSIVYIAVENGESGIPDIDAPMASQLKEGAWEIHQKIKEIAQRKGMKGEVMSFFDANLVPNIPTAVLPSVLDDIDALVRDAVDVKKRRRDALKQAYQQRKSDASYLAEVWLIAVCNGTNKKDEAQGLRTVMSETDGIVDPFTQICQPI